MQGRLLAYQSFKFYQILLWWIGWAKIAQIGTIRWNIHQENSHFLQIWQWWEKRSWSQASSFYKQAKQYANCVPNLMNLSILDISHCKSSVLVYDRNHYFGLGPIPKPKPKLADTFSRYRNQNYILKGESSYR